MNQPHDAIVLIEEWLSDGPEVAPDRVLAAVSERLPTTRQERPPLTNRVWPLNAVAVSAIAAAILLAIGYLLARPDIGSFLFPPPTPTATTTGFDVGDVLAFTRGGDLWVSSADGTHTHQLTTGGAVGAAAWSPDGSLLAYDQGGDLYTMDSEGSVGLVADEGGPFFGPSWSPDGSRLVATNPDGFAVVSLDGSVQALSQRSLGLCVSSPEWGPTDLIVFTGNPDCATGAEPTSLYTVRPDGSGLRKLFGHGSQVLSAAWSPDGQRIAFVDLAGDGCIHVIDADGKNASLVKAHCTQAFPITWTPDASRVAWAGGARGEAPAFVINVDGSGLASLAGLTSVANLDWRPSTP